MRLSRSLALLASLLLAACAAPTSEPAPASTTSSLSEGEAVTNVPNLRLRSAPSLDAEVLVEMPLGARVRVTGATRSGFAPVVYAGRSGWAWAEYLTQARPVVPGSVEEVVDTLGREASRRSPGTDLALAVMDLTTNEYAGWEDAVPHVSASSAKAIWVAAAVERAGVARVAPIAEPIFARSDNELSGTAIDLAGGIDAVNEFYWRNDMPDSAVTQWYATRISRTSPRRMGSDNYFTARDAVAFLARLDRGQILDEAATEAVRGWMTLSPRSGFGGSLGTLLPERARATMMHKSGWLPPGCCGDDATYNSLTEIGVIAVPGGHRYAVAILARRGTDYYGAQARLVEHASCAIYRAVSKDGSVTCLDGP